VPDSAAAPVVIALAVEREMGVLLDLLFLLRAEGCDPLGAPDCIEACALMETFAPSLILLDPELPLAPAVIARARIMNVPVVALCAAGADFAVQPPWEGVLVKPPDPDQLIGLLDSLISSRGKAR
jgi:DNA-binding response OmpR family regulator